MKKLLLSLMMIGLLSSTVLADAFPQKKVERAARAYKAALKSENPGVRNGALMGLAQVKVLDPDYNFNDVKRTLLWMAARDKSNIVRVNAQLLYTYLDCQTLQRAVDVDPFEDADGFFIKIYREMNRQNVALNQ